MEIEAIAASPGSGVDSMTDEEAAEALDGEVAADGENSSLVPNAAYSRLGRFVP
jgi:hypothetical protein